MTKARDLANSANGASIIADDAVDADAIAANAVITAGILNANVTTAKIADANVTTAKITDANVTTAKIADANVTQGKLADQAVNEAKMQVSNAPSNGYFLSAQSGNTGGLTWAQAGGGGKVLQLTNTWNTTYASQSPNNKLSAVEASITPSASSSKIAVFTVGSFDYNGGFELWLYRVIGSSATLIREFRGNNTSMGNTPVNYIDSPNTTSAVTYKYQISAGGNVYVNSPNGYQASSMILMEIDNA
tara:strand:- start:120 stop:857 length:738 start_codon:yes stop_codon:yes gene_type:complete